LMKLYFASLHSRRKKLAVFKSRPWHGSELVLSA